MDRTAAFYSAPSYHHRGSGGFPVYSGSRRQRGGSILGSLAKVAMPMLKSFGKAALGQAVGFAKDVAGDLADGGNLRQALKRRGMSRLQNTAMSGLSTIAGRAAAHAQRRRPQQVTRRTAPLGKRRAAPPRHQPKRKKARQALF